MELLSDPHAWIAFLTLTALELVLGIDNIIFVSIRVYFAMAFSICVEMLNLRVRKRPPKRVPRRLP
jgi:predicted tellurium resistance membrane protein TerC